MNKTALYNTDPKVWEDAAKRYRARPDGGPTLRVLEGNVWGSLGRPEWLSITPVGPAPGGAGPSSHLSRSSRAPAGCARSASPPTGNRFQLKALPSGWTLPPTRRESGPPRRRWPCCRCCSRPCAGLPRACRARPRSGTSWRLVHPGAGNTLLKVRQTTPSKSTGTKTTKKTMKTIATFLLITPLLFSGCSKSDSTPANNAPAPDAVKPQSASPKHFWFDYQFEPSPGKRNWTRLDNATWIEEYGSGVSSRFKIIGHETVKGTSGTLVAKVTGDSEQTQTGNEGDFQVFIPNLGSTPMRLWCRNKINGVWEEWKFLNEMQGVE